MAIFRFIAIFVLIAGLVSPVRSAEIDGQVSIVTKGGKSVMFGLIAVSLYDSETLRNALAAGIKAGQPITDYFRPIQNENSRQRDSLLDEHERLFKRQSLKEDDPNLKARLAQTEDEMEKLQKNFDDDFAFAFYRDTSLYYFKILPPALQSTKTDKNGRFSFQINNGSLVLVATGTVQVAGKSEIYYWMVKVPPGNQPKITIPLSNNNCTYAESPDSFLDGMKFEDEIKVREVMRDHDMAWLLNYIEERKRKDAAAEKK